MTSVSKLNELGAKRAQLEAEFNRAKAEFLAKMEVVESEMRAVRTASVTLKPGEVVVTRRGEVKISKVSIWHDGAVVYGFRKAPSGRWSQKERAIYELNEEIEAA